ncbi:hypothetical protein C8J57DRAFT_352902 [Mycena rebaudengoi]|nr:hypothetical protein C8J57DRAFT_352902 [Mycena rebaudengoi]
MSRLPRTLELEVGDSSWRRASLSICISLAFLSRCLLLLLILFFRVCGRGQYRDTVSPSSVGLVSDPAALGTYSANLWHSIPSPPAHLLPADGESAVLLNGFYLYLFSSSSSVVFVFVDCVGGHRFPPGFLRDRTHFLPPPGKEAQRCLRLLRFLAQGGIEIHIKAYPAIPHCG